MKPHNAATEELTMKFDCDSNNVAMFCKKIIDRANESGWKSGGVNTLEISDSDGVTRNVLTEYAMISSKKV